MGNQNPTPLPHRAPALSNCQTHTNFYIFRTPVPTILKHTDLRNLFNTPNSEFPHLDDDLNLSLHGVAHLCTSHPLVGRSKDVPLCVEIANGCSNGKISETSKMWVYRKVAFDLRNGRYYVSPALVNPPQAGRISPSRERTGTPLECTITPDRTRTNVNLRDQASCPSRPQEGCWPSSECSWGQRIECFSLFSGTEKEMRRVLPLLLLALLGHRDNARAIMALRTQATRCVWAYSKGCAKRGIRQGSEMQQQKS